MAGAFLSLALALSTTAVGGAAPSKQSDVELVGAFVVGAPLTGAALSGDRLYLTTIDRLSIYDIGDPANPVQLASEPSPHPIHGERISTDDRLLLLNDPFLNFTVDVWDVEDEGNPILVSTVRGVDDEHFSCLLDCRWAYGSAGSVIDLSRPSKPVLKDFDWKSHLDLPDDVWIHRVDEYKRGFMVTAPRPGDAPVIIDARQPLNPKIIARVVFPPMNRRGFLYSTWPNEGKSRFLFSSVEYSNSRNCSGDEEGALISFDAKGWPAKWQFQEADRFKIRGAGEGSQDCASYYFSLHPRFEQTGLILVPYGREGVRIVEVGKQGRMSEVGYFDTALFDIWHSLWASDDIFYAADYTGAVYVLRFVR
ncbi:MAG TPA: hypothetical protein VNP73_08460 [Actinomycetota bacterium]|nr:hypothetical protein [Actinomycetota bacterium]